MNPVALQDPINQNKSKMTFKESKNENTVIVRFKDLQPTKKCICQQLVRRETGGHITHSRPQSVVQSLDRTFQRITHSPTDSEHFLGQSIQKWGERDWRIQGWQQRPRKRTLRKNYKEIKQTCLSLRAFLLSHNLLLWRIVIVFCPYLGAWSTLLLKQRNRFKNLYRTSLASHDHHEVVHYLNSS